MHIFGRNIFLNQGKKNHYHLNYHYFWIITIFWHMQLHDFTNISDTHYYYYLQALY